MCWAAEFSNKNIPLEGERPDSAKAIWESQSQLVEGLEESAQAYELEGQKVVTLPPCKGPGSPERSAPEATSKTVVGTSPRRFLPRVDVWMKGSPATSRSPSPDSQSQAPCYRSARTTTRDVTTAGSWWPQKGDNEEFVPRWERLHMGLTERDAMALGVTVPRQSVTQRAKQRLQAMILPEEVRMAAPVVALPPFPPIAARKGGRPEQTHYEYFARRCPLESPLKRAHMQQIATTGRRCGNQPQRIREEMRAMQCLRVQLEFGGGSHTPPPGPDPGMLTWKGAA